MEGKTGYRSRLILAGLVLAAIVPASGCIVGLPAQIGWMIWGLKKPAEYSGLKNQRVAIVCHSNASGYGPDRALRLLNNKLHYELSNNVKKIRMVRKSEVDNWIDHNGLSERDLLEVGSGVQADKLVAVKILSYTLHEGTTLFRGRAAYTVTVYDMTDGGKQVWTSGREEFEFPKHSGMPAIETSEPAFEAQFVDLLGLRIARLFYDFDLAEDYAEEGAIQ